MIHTADLVFIDGFFELLVKLYQLIERGHPWPTHTTLAKAMWLHKPDTKPSRPLTFRVITITSWTYRLWCPIRVADLEPWTTTWAHPALFSALKGAGGGGGGRLL